MQRPTSSTIHPCTDQGGFFQVKWNVDGAANGRFRLIDLIDDMCAGKDVFFRLVRAVEDIMPNNVKILTLDNTVEMCLKFMKNNKVRHVPVVDIPTAKGKKPYFVGVVSQRDIFRQISPKKGKVGEEKTDPKAQRQLLGQIVTRRPKSVSPETPIPSMLATMLDNHVDMLPVLVNGDLVSVVTTTDILKMFVRLNNIRRLCSKGKKEEKARNRIRFGALLSGGIGEVAAVFSSVFQTVQDIMTEDVVSLSPEANLDQAIEVIQEAKIRHLPVVDKQNVLVGLVSDRDVLRYLPFVPGQRLPEAGTFRSRLFEVGIKDPSLSTPLKCIMTRNMVHVLPGCSFYDAVKMLHEMRVSCLPVVDEGKKLRGIITVTNVMRALLTAYELAKKSQS